MNRLYAELRHRLRSLASRRRANQELEDELQHHIELETEERIRRGEAPAEARRQAAIAFGSLGAVREQTREQRGTALLEQTARDLRLGFRSLLRTPRFTATALLTLTLGVGGALVIFAIVDAVLLRPLPFDRPNQLVQIHEITPEGHPFSTSDLNLSDLRERSLTFRDMAAISFSNQQLLFEHGTDRAERIGAAQVTGNFFEVLGVALQAGRPWTREETAPGTRPRLVLLSDLFWQRFYQRDTDVVGREIRIGGEPWTVTGILPADFDFGLDADVFTPYPLDLEHPRGDHRLLAYGRLADGVSVEAAQNELVEIYSAMTDDYPEDLGGWTVRAEPIHRALIGATARTSSWALLAAVGLLLFLACANVSCLLLARATTRSHELATRRALGADRLRLLRQLFTESALLGALGAGAGFAMAVLALPLIRRMANDALPRIENAALDLRTTSLAVGLAVITTLLFGSAPAWRASRNAATARRAIAEGTALRSLLVVAQLAGALMLTASSFVLIRSFGELRSVQPGFDPEDLLAVDVVLPRGAYSEEERSVVDFYVQALDAVRNLPGVDDAAAHVTHPFRGPRLANTVALPHVTERRDFIEVDWRSISDGTFRTLKTPLLRGREFRRNEERLACILSAQLADILFGSEDPIGKLVRWRVPDGPQLLVVGVVADVHDVALSQPVRPTLYWHQSIMGRADMTLLVRSGLPPEQLADGVRGAVRSIDARVAPPEITEVSRSLHSSLSNSRLNSQIFTAFGSMALLIALVGLYGLLAFTTACRSDEIGLRVALGARPAQIRDLVLRQALLLLAAGVVVGLAGLVASMRLIEQLLFETAPLDPQLLGTSAGAFVLVALLAALLPAQRAAGLDPLKSLRSD